MLLVSIALYSTSNYHSGISTVEVHAQSPVIMDFGQLARLVCTFDGYLPLSGDYEVQWRDKNEAVLTSDGYHEIILQRKQDQLQSNLIIPSLSREDEGIYTCELLPLNITATIEARIKGKLMTITMKQFLSLLLELDTISFNQPNNFVYLNDPSNTVQLNCSVNVSGLDLYFNWNWTGPAVDSGRTTFTSNTARAIISTLTIDSPSTDDNGLYTCTATYADSVNDGEYVCINRNDFVNTNLTGTNYINLTLAGMISVFTSYIMIV